MSKINWKVRVKNKQFWINLVTSAFGIILAYFGMNWEQLTTWESIWRIIFQAVQNPVVVIAILACVWNAINDPTTKGIGDSENAITYNYPK